MGVRGLNFAAMEAGTGIADCAYLALCRAYQYCFTDA